MSDDVASPLDPGATEYRGARPRLRPNWLYPALTLFVIGAHVAYFASGIYWPNSAVVPLGTIDAELLPEGDTLDLGDIAPEGDTPEEQKEAKAEPDEVAPLPESKESELVEKKPPPKKKPIEKPKEKKPVEKKEANASKAGKRVGVPGGMGLAGGSTRSGGRFGVAGGRGKALGAPGASQATCLAAVASSIRRHMPGATTLGPGSVYVTFYVNSGGGISGVSTSGSAAHAALARRIVGSSRGPASCASAFASQTIIFQ